MSDFERLEEVRHHLRLSFPKLAEVIGLKSPQTFYDIKSGKNKISKELASKIVDVYPSISLEWLLRGTTEMLRETPAVSAHEIEGGNAQASGEGASASVNRDPGDLIAIIARYQQQIEKLLEDARKEREQLLADAQAERERLLAQALSERSTLYSIIASKDS